MNRFYYQKVDDIGKEIAVVTSSEEINDEHYRPINKDYYYAVIEFLREQAKETEVDETEEVDENAD